MLANIVYILYHIRTNVLNIEGKNYMITLRNFNKNDIYFLQDLKYGDMSHNEIEKMIEDWNTKEYDGKYFEMFAVVSDDTIVGSVSLYHHSKSVVICGAEIFKDFRHNNYAYNAVMELFKIAKEKGYKIATGQVRTDNIASLALCRKLGFESDNYEYINKKANPVYIFMKSLL